MKKIIGYAGLLILSVAFVGICYAQDVTINTNTAWSAGTYTYDNVLVTNGATLTFNGAVTLNAQNLTVDSTSSISSDAKGYSAEQGPGKGNDGSGSGAGYGGNGGKGWGNIPGGSIYGSSTIPIDMGSGGDSAHSAGGSGGGAIKLNIQNTFVLEGTLSANGGNSGPLGYYGSIRGGGGSGGSIYVITKKFNGTGSITTNGGEGYGGGGGGRVAVYYQNTSFTGKTEAKGGNGVLGTSYNGQDGTVVLNASSADSAFTAFYLTEKTFTASVLSETISIQSLILNNVLVSGGLNGSLNFTDLEIIKIDTGIFSSKGFSKGEFQIDLEGASYTGAWNGIIYPDPKEKKLYLKGEIEGELNGICEATLTESIPGSGIYDKYEATWRINRLKTDCSVTLNLSGALTYQPSYSFTSQLYFYQAAMEGNAFGFYTGPLSAVVTHLRLSDENEFKGKGFSIVSYNSLLGQGEAYAYNQLSAPGRVEFQGLFSNPILGKVNAFLDENLPHKTLSGTIERLDLGVAPQPDLEVKVWGHRGVSPGQTIDYIIEVSNDGVKSAENVPVIDRLPWQVKYKSSTGGGIYDSASREVIWNLPNLGTQSRVYLTVKGEVEWGLPGHVSFENIVNIPKEVITVEDDPTINLDYRTIEATEDHVKMIAHATSPTMNEDINIDLKMTEIPEAVEPNLSYIENPDGMIEIKGQFTVDWHSSGLEDVSIMFPRWMEYIPGMREFRRDAIEEQKFLNWLREKEYISETNYRTFTEKNRAYPWTARFLPGAAGRLQHPVEGYLENGTRAAIDGFRHVYNPEQLRSAIQDSFLTERHQTGPQELSDARDEYLRDPTVSDSMDSQDHVTVTAGDPNELLVSPEGDVKPGDKLNYTINFENEGEGDAYGVYVTDTLLDNLDDSTLVVNNGGKYDAATRTITWFIGELLSKQKGSVTFSVNVNKDAPDKADIINFATVYFPSVPEITRTNGAMNTVTTLTDNVAPVTQISVAPLPNQAGWNKADVTVGLTAADNESGTGVKEIHYKLSGAVSEEKVIVSNAAQISITQEGITTLTYYSSDNAGNIEPQKVREIKIDKTPPVISAQALPQPNALGWNNTDVTVSFIATDICSGIAFVTQPITVTSEGKDQLIGGEAIDLAGNSASTSVSLSIDKTQPIVTIITPTEQAEYILKESVLSSWQVQDALSGIASAEGTVSNASAIDTATVGTKSFNVTALDNAGNKLEKTNTYYVRYAFGGILSPINPDGSSIFKLGRTIPVKFQLKDANGNFINSAVARLYIAKISNDVVGTEVEVESAGEANTGNLFRYDATDNQYLFNLGASVLSAGTWQLRISLDDGSSKYVNTALR